MQLGVSFQFWFSQESFYMVLTFIYHYIYSVSSFGAANESHYYWMWIWQVNLKTGYFSTYKLKTITNLFLDDTDQLFFFHQIIYMYIYDFLNSEHLEHAYYSHT